MPQATPQLRLVLLTAIGAALLAQGVLRAGV